MNEKTPDPEAFELFRLRGQSKTLIITESPYDGRRSVLENPIFFHEVFDDMLLMLVHPASDRDDKKQKWVQSRAHRHILLLRCDVLPPNHLNEIEFLNTRPFNHQLKQDEA